MLPPWWPHKADTDKDNAQDENANSANGDGAETQGNSSEPAQDPPKDGDSATV